MCFLRNLVSILCIINVFIYLCNSTPFVEKYFNQKLDHFNSLDHRYFNQRYLIQDKWWGGPTYPIFFYTGNEGNIENFWNNTGFMFDIAPQFKALVIFAEHRYYGKTLPFGDDSFKLSNVGFLNINQALADFATLLGVIKTSVAPNSAIISFGGSYGGILTAYLKLKYPSIIQGGLAASAPVNAITNLKKRDSYFFQYVTKSFAAYPSCDEQVRLSFLQIIREKHYTSINKVFNLCKPIHNDAGLYQLLGWLRNAFVTISMVNYPYPSNFLGNLPGFPVNKSCQLIDKFYPNPYKSLSAVAFLLYGSNKCHDIWTEYMACADPTGCGVGNDGLAWDYQACTDMLTSGGTNSKTDMFPNMPFTMADRKAYCNNRWNTTDWSTFNQENFAPEGILQLSNLIFSNGNLDPWRGGGIMKSVGSRIIALEVEGGAHHLDLRANNKLDPQSVIDTRKQEIMWIEKWIKDYNSNL